MNEKRKKEPKLVDKSECLCLGEGDLFLCAFFPLCC